MHHVLSIIWIVSLSISHSSSSHLSGYVTSFGYPFEEHENIETEDGYLLDIHRIPHGKSDGKSTGNHSRPVVFLMHCLSCCSDVFTVTGPEKGLAFLLADRGYDVWMGNARGTSHSRKHRVLSPETRDFWDFSWHEIGIYDLPAMLNYTLFVSRQPNLFYVGYSQGGTAYFVMMSQRPEMNPLVKLMVGLAPGAFYGNDNRFVLKAVASYIYHFLDSLANIMEVYELGANVKALMCNPISMMFEPCEQTVARFAAIRPNQLSPQVASLVTRLIPDPASVRQYLHYVQLVLSCQFRQYDFGSKINMKRYNSTEPPAYNVSRNEAPTWLVYAPSDFFVTGPNTEKLGRLLPNLVGIKRVEDDHFRHTDFLFAKNVVNLVYNDLFDVLERFNH